VEADRHPAICPRPTCRPEASGQRNRSNSRSSPTSNRITLSLARVKGTVLTVLEADGVIERIGADHVHDRIPDAITASRRRAALVQTVSRNVSPTRQI